MSRIRSKDTKLELLVRKFLHKNGFRYRLHAKDLPGKPDIVLPKYKTVIFIHGCFWHGHEGCKYFTIPQTRSQWWVEKISRNKINDQHAIRNLEYSGWTIYLIWGCELKKKILDFTLLELLRKLKSAI